MKHGVQLSYNFAFGSIPQQLDGDGRERALKIVSTRKRLFGHPDNGEAPIVRHEIAWLDGVDEFRRQGCPDDHKVPLAAVQQRGKARAYSEAVSLCESVVDDDLVGPARLGCTASSHIKLIKIGLTEIGQRNDISGRRLGIVRNVQQSELGDLRLNPRHSWYLCDLLDTLLGARVTTAKTSANR